MSMHLFGLSKGVFQAMSTPWAVRERAMPPLPGVNQYCHTRFKSVTEAKFGPAAGEGGPSAAGT